MSSDGGSREVVLRGYGEVMLVVQSWEQALGLVWWRAKRKHKNRPTGEVDSERSQKEIMRLEAAFLRMTAQAVREAVAPLLEPATAAGLEDLMTERNRLAHRFLREQSADRASFKPGTHDQLISLGNRFMDSFDSIMSFEPYTGPIPEHWIGLAERITERLFTGETIPKDPRQQ